MRGWFRGLRWRRPRPAPQPSRPSPGEAIIISKSGHTEESWATLTDSQRADIRWRVGA